MSKCSCAEGHAMLCPVHAEEALDLMDQLIETGHPMTRNGSDE